MRRGPGWHAPVGECGLGFEMIDKLHEMCLYRLSVLKDCLTFGLLSVEHQGYYLIEIYLRETRLDVHHRLLYMKMAPLCCGAEWFVFWSVFVTGSGVSGETSHADGAVRSSLTGMRLIRSI